MDDLKQIIGSINSISDKYPIYKHVTGGHGEQAMHYLDTCPENSTRGYTLYRYTMVFFSFTFLLYPEFYERLRQLNVTSDFETIDIFNNKQDGK